MRISKFNRYLFGTLSIFLVSCGTKAPEKVIVPTSISFSFSSENVEAGEAVTIQDVKVYPENATNKEVVYLLDSYTNDKNIATLDGNKITTISEGQVTVTVQSVANPSVKTDKSFAISPVSIKSAELSLSKNEVTVGETVIANLVTLPKNAKNSAYTLFAEPKDAVQINGNKITALKKGTINVFAKTANNVVSNTVSLKSNEQVKEKELVITTTNNHLYIGDSASITSFVDSTSVSPKYSTVSGDNNVISISGNKIKAVAPGNEVIRGYLNDNTTTGLLSISVEDDMLLVATPESGATLDYAKLADEEVPAMLGSGHETVVALTTNGAKYSSNYPSITLKLPQSVDTSKQTLALDVFSDLAYNWMSVKIYDSNHTLLGKELGKDFTYHKWTRFSVQSSFSDVRYVQFTVNYEKAAGVDSTVYLDMLNLRKGINFEKGLSLNESSANFKMPTYDLTNFVENQLCVEVKADGSGTNAFTLQESVPGAWYNITGKVTLTFENGVLTSASVPGINCQFVTLDDGWYGVYVPFKGDGAINASSINLLYSDDKVQTDVFYIDTKGIVPSMGTFIQKGATLQISSNDGAFNYISYSSLIKKDAYTEIKIRPRGTGTIKFAYMDKGTWENISGTITIVTENSKVTKVYTGSGAADKIGTFEELEDGWFAIRLTESQMQYPGGQSGTAQGIGLIYGANSCTCDSYELDNHSFKVTSSEDIIDPEGEDIYDEGC